MRKSLLLAALGWAMPMYMSDVTAAAAPMPTPAPVGGNSTDNAEISAAPEVATVQSGETASGAVESGTTQADTASIPSTSATVTSADASSTPSISAASAAADAPNAAGGASAAASSAPVDSAPAVTPSQSVGEPGNAVAPSESVAASLLSSAATGTAEAGGEAPNVASGAVEPSPSADGSATNADGPGTSSLTVASSGAELPLHARIAHHLEEIYQLARSEATAPARSLLQEAVELKAHIAETLHKLHNGIAVSEGVLVQKLESIHRLL